jgi:hypothetical protein
MSSNLRIIGSSSHNIETSLSTFSTILKALSSSVIVTLELFGSDAGLVGFPLADPDVVIYLLVFLLLLVIYLAVCMLRLHVV